MLSRAQVEAIANGDTIHREGGTTRTLAETTLELVRWLELIYEITGLPSEAHAWLLNMTFEEYMNEFAD